MHQKRPKATFGRHQLSNLIVNDFGMAKVKFPLPQVNDTVLGSFSSNRPYV